MVAWQGEETSESVLRGTREPRAPPEAEAERGSEAGGARWASVRSITAAREAERNIEEKRQHTSHERRGEAIKEGEHREVGEEAED